MFCNKCGEILRDGALRCPVCGASQKKASKINTECDCETNRRVTFDANRPKTHSTYTPGGWTKKNFADRYPIRTNERGAPSLGTFLNLIRAFFQRSLDFGGRSSRFEFWWTYLFIFLTAILLSDSLTLVGLWFLVILVPFTALGVRRLHDIGKSGWGLLLKAIPVFGVVLLIAAFCQPSAPENQWGRPQK